MRHVTKAGILILAAALAGCDSQGNPPWTSPPAAGKNEFKGSVKAEFLVPAPPADYFRDMRLLEPFGYVDPDGVAWDVPAGAVTNGASVPWGFWNIIGGPYDGPYRDAAVIHDYFVEKKTRTWEDTHRMFYHAVLARGVSDTLARTMYAGVRYGGPRWDVVPEPSPNNAGAANVKPAESKTVVAGAATPPAAPAAAARAAAPIAPQAPDTKPLAPVEAPAPPVRSLGRSMASDQEVRNFDELRLWIEREKPSLEAIDQKVEQMRSLEGKPAAPTP